MTWYKAGTANFTNGSDVVTGNATSWDKNVEAGDMFRDASGAAYEVAAVEAADMLRLFKPYAGLTASAAPYDVVPTQDRTRGLTAEVTQLILDYAMGIGGATGSSKLRLTHKVTDHTLEPLDGNGTTKIIFGSTTPVKLTIPPQSVVPVESGKTVLFMQAGDGGLTLEGGTGVSLRTATSLSTRTKFSAGGATKIDTNEWIVFGDLAASTGGASSPAPAPSPSPAPPPMTPGVFSLTETNDTLGDPAPLTTVLHNTGGGVPVSDDAAFNIGLPFPVVFNGTSYTDVFVGSNSFLTFGLGSEAYASLGAGSPPLPGIHVHANDGHMNSLHTGLVSPGVFRVRFVGNFARMSADTGTVITWEATFYETPPAGTNGVVTVVVDTSVTGGSNGVFSDSAKLAESVRPASTAYNFASGTTSPVLLPGQTEYVA